MKGRVKFPKPQILHSPNYSCSLSLDPHCLVNTAPLRLQFVTETKAHFPSEQVNFGGRGGRFKCLLTTTLLCCVFISPWVDPEAGETPGGLSAGGT